LLFRKIDAFRGEFQIASADRRPARGSQGDIFPELIRIGNVMRRGTETSIYSKSNVLYHMDRAKEGIRRQDFAILVEATWMRLPWRARESATWWRAAGQSCGAADQIAGPIQRRVVVNYDPDAAGQTATERSLVLLPRAGFSRFAC